MNIVVLLKRVPTTDSLIIVADDGVSVKKNELNWEINPYDEFAAEEALRIKEAHGGTVTILSVGLEKTQDTIRTALAMGADRGILINDQAVEDIPSLGIARLLATAIGEMQFDLIIAGQRSTDDEGWQVGTMVAEILKIPSISQVIEQEISDGKIRCKRTVEGGTITLEASLPVLFTTQRGLNEPRYASLPGIMKAKKMPLDIKNFSDLGLDAVSLTQTGVRIVSMNPPHKRKAGQIIDGENVYAKATKLVNLLHEELKVI